MSAIGRSLSIGSEIASPEIVAICLEGESGGTGVSEWHDRTAIGGSITARADRDADLAVDFPIRRGVPSDLTGFRHFSVFNVAATD